MFGLTYKNLAMSKSHKATPKLRDVIEAAMYDAFLKAAERAKRTHTYLVVQKGDKIERIPFDKIDEFVASQSTKGGI